MYNLYENTVIYFKLFKNVCVVALMKGTIYIAYVSRATEIRNKDWNAHVFTRVRKHGEEGARYICMRTQSIIVLSLFVNVDYCLM